MQCHGKGTTFALHLVTSSHLYASLPVMSCAATQRGCCRPSFRCCCWPWAVLDVHEHAHSGVQCASYPAQNICIVLSAGDMLELSVLFCLQETLKSVVAQYNASQLLTMREVVSKDIRRILTERARHFNLVLVSPLSYLLFTNPSAIPPV